MINIQRDVQDSIEGALFFFRSMCFTVEYRINSRSQSSPGWASEKLANRVSMRAIPVCAHVKLANRVSRLLSRFLKR